MEILLKLLSTMVFLLRIHSELTPNFKGCEDFFYEFEQPINCPPTLDTVEICQNQNIETEDMFVTKYDTSLKIPLYSAYILNVSRPCLRNDSWYIEKELDDYQQALENDYEQSESDRGHLAQNCYLPPEQTRLAFALTNVVPLMNRNEWENIETKSKHLMKSKCNNGIAYFITGAIPGNSTMVKINGESTDVNIPSHLYTAACCKTFDEELFSFGYIGENKNNSVITILDVVTLGTNISHLSNYLEPVELFYEGCNYHDTTALNELISIMVNHEVESGSVCYRQNYVTSILVFLFSMLFVFKEV